MTLRILTIKKSSEFKKISKTNKKFHAKTILLLSFPTSSCYFYNQEQGKNAEKFCRVGYTVSKTVGNAVVRNLAKRRLREAVLKLFPQYAKLHNDYVIIAKREIAQADFKIILSDLKFCLKRINS